MYISNAIVLLILIMGLFLGFVYYQINKTKTKTKTKTSKEKTEALPTVASSKPEKVSPKPEKINIKAATNWVNIIREYNSLFENQYKKDEKEYKDREIKKAYIEDYYLQRRCSNKESELYLAGVNQDDIKTEIDRIKSKAVKLPTRNAEENNIYLQNAETSLKTVTIFFRSSNKTQTHTSGKIVVYLSLNKSGVFLVKSMLNISKDLAE